MATYRGTVRVRNPDGEEIDIEANLESRVEQPGGVESWDGTMVGGPAPFGP